jgi:hypothetical protein
MIWLRRAVFLCVGLGYFLFPNARPDLTVLNADDSAAYAALGYALSHGLGYTRSLDVGAYIPHTTWPPGFPLLIAPAAALSGLPIHWLFLKITTILIALAGIVFAWFYIRRVTLNENVASLGALVLALLPYYWWSSRMVLTEVPAVVFSLGSLLLIDIVWRGRRPAGWQVALAGLICGLGMLIRGTVLGLALVPLGYLHGRRDANVSTRRYVGFCVLHIFCFALPLLAWFVRNRSIESTHLGLDGVNQIRMLIQTNPIDPASPTIGLSDFVMASFRNVKYRIIYNIPDQLVPGMWTQWWHGGPHGPILAGLLTSLIAGLTLPRKPEGAPLFIVIAAWCGLLLIYAGGDSTGGGSTRLWIPITSLIAIMVTINAAPAMAALRATSHRVAYALIPLVFGVSLVPFIRSVEAMPYVGDSGDLVALLSLVRTMPRPPAATLTGHPQLFTLSTGLPAPMTNSHLGIEPVYTHLLTRDESVGFEAAIPVPAGSRERLRVGAWCLYALPGAGPQ